MIRRLPGEPPNRCGLTEQESGLFICTEERQRRDELEILIRQMDAILMRMGMSWPDAVERRLEDLGLRQ